MNSLRLRRREVLGRATAAAVLPSLGACAALNGRASAGRVVVVGGGFGGATAARYLRRWAPEIEVTLVERHEHFVSCPMSNLVLAGLWSLDDLTRGYAGLTRHGVRMVRDEALHIDPDRRQVRLASGAVLAYDRLILSPGIDFRFDAITGLAEADAQGRVLHAWKAGPQTLALRRQLEALPDGGVVALSIPKAPYRCPPGPYERACLIAHYLQRAKPRAKLLVLDANSEIVSKKALFEEAWRTLYPGRIEYRPDSEALAFDARAGVLQMQTEDVRADVYNVIAPQRAGRIASPLISVNGQWVGVGFQDFQSTQIPGIHVIGDAIAGAPGMPKSATMASHQAKWVADAVIAALTGQAPDGAPILSNTCYSFVSDREAMHVASVHRWDDAQRTLLPVPGAGGVSAARNEPEARLAVAWARSLWADALD